MAIKKKAKAKKIKKPKKTTKTKTIKKTKKTKKRTSASKAARKPVKRKAAPKKTAAKKRAKAKPKAVRKPASTPTSAAPTLIAPRPFTPTPVATTPVAPPPGERIGKVTHYFNHLSVVIIELDAGSLRIGDVVHIKGNTSDFQQRVDSMEIDRVNVNEAGQGKSLGLRVRQPAREQDLVYKVRQ